MGADVFRYRIDLRWDCKRRLWVADIVGRSAIGSGSGDTPTEAVDDLWGRVLRDDLAPGRLALVKARGRG